MENLKCVCVCVGGGGVGGVSGKEPKTATHLEYGLECVFIGSWDGHHGEVAHHSRGHGVTTPAGRGTGRAQGHVLTEKKHYKVS